jgi:hypothetical protein
MPRDEQPAVYRTRTVPRTRARLGPIFVVVARSHHENTRRGQNGSLRLECNTSAAFREGVRLGTIRPSSALHARFGTVDPVISVNGAVERKAHAMVLVLGLAYCLRTIHSSFMKLVRVLYRRILDSQSSLRYDSSRASFPFTPRPAMTFLPSARPSRPTPRPRTR